MTIIDAQSIAAPLGKARRSGQGWICCCPAHNDGTASLSVSDSGDGRVLLHCHAGCAQEQVIAELKKRGLWHTNGGHQGRGERIYDYVDPSGLLLYQVIRKPNKEFPQRRPDGNGGWVWKLDGVSRVPYRLPEALEGIKAGRDIFIAEGEKDADNLFKLGLVATTNSGGAGNWSDELSLYLVGAKTCIVVPDNDDPGRKHAGLVAQSISNVSVPVKVIALPGLPPKGDASDWIAAGGTKEQLIQMCEDASLWCPSQVIDSPTDERTLGRDSVDWPEPQEIRSELLPVPAMSEILIPDSLRPWVRDMAHRMQVPLSFAATGAMVVAGSLIGAGCGIKPKRKDDWLVIPNLWGYIVARPGKLKSPTLAAVTAPLARLEATAKEAYQEAFTDHEVQKAEFDNRQKAINDLMRKAAKAEEEGK